MNQNYVVCDAGGLILLSGACHAADVFRRPLAAGEEIVLGAGGPETHYVLDNEVVPRPTVAATNTTRAVDQDWVLPYVPDGTEVTIAGTLAGTTTGGLTLAFPAPGLWTVKLDPPWPWIGVEVAVEVTP